MINLNHLDRDVAEVATEGRATRQRYLDEDDQFVPWRAGEALLERAIDIALGGPVDPPHLLVLAPPKAGVGRILKEIERRTETRGRLRRHSVPITAPVEFSGARVVRALAAALDVPGTWRASLDQQMARVSGAISDLEVRVLIVRRLHNLPDKYRRPYLAHLHELADGGEFRLLMTSLRSHRKVLDSRPELKAHTQVIEIGPLPEDTDAVDFVGRVLRRLPLRRETTVTPEFANALFSRTGGYVGRIYGLLKAAAKEAIGDDEHLTEESLQKASAFVPRSVWRDL